jgi:hypothetical protein
VAFVSFSQTNSSSAVAFRILLAASIVAAIMAATGVALIARHAHRMKSANRAMIDVVSSQNLELAETVAALNQEIHQRMKSLDRHLPNIDWSFDAAEHDRSVYDRMRKAVENDETAEFKVLTIFRDVKSEEVSAAQRQAISGYYKSLEQALLDRRGFVYERLVVLRPAIGRTGTARELLAGLLLARPDFVEHSRWLMRAQNFALGARTDLRFYGDTGRLFDIGFAVALDRQRNPLSLLLEIGTTRPGNGSSRSVHPVLGLIVIEKPSLQLAEAFLFSHQALLTEGMAVDHISEETVRDVLRLR